MAVAYVSGSSTGATQSTTTLSPSVPAGVAIGDVVVAFFGQWNGGTNITFSGTPSGWTQSAVTWQSGDGGARNSFWWKRLTAADSGTYSWTWSPSSWTTIQLQAFSGVIGSGSPIGTSATATGTWGSVSSLGALTVNVGDALVWCVYNDTSGTHTPATGYTETADVDSATMAYKFASSTSETASGGSITSSSSAGAALISLLNGAANYTQSPTDLAVPTDYSGAALYTPRLTWTVNET